MYSRFVGSSNPASVTKETANGFWIHDKAEDMPHVPLARFTHGANANEFFAFSCCFPANDSVAGVQVSRDRGKTWTRVAPFDPEGHLRPSDSGAFIRTRKGTLIAAFSNLAERANWNWDEHAHDSPGAMLPTYVVRSTDGGKSWCDLQRLHTSWTGANRDMIETSDGRVVFTSMQLRHNPGRHTVLTYASDNEGASWQASNVIDLGGAGNHGGVTEATLVALNDGNLLKYIRTNWGQFWQARSSDGGLHWHPYGPTGIDAASAPGALLRLQNGRIALVWNRYYPEGKTEVELRGGDSNWSATPTSNFRHELSISFSNDECESWSAPVVVARNPTGEVSYPYLFEPYAGELWITAHRFGLRMRIKEQDI